ncbi:MAG: CmcJ/NvfI family oxidoreductase [Pseudomonadota bacterium]
MAGAHIDTFIRYSDRSAEGGFIRANGDYSFGMEDHPARVHNARLEAIEFASNGFTLLKHTTDVDFADAADVKSRYYPEACQLVQSLTGASEVFAFLGILRGGDENLGGGPALSAHVDFNEASLRGWVQRLAPDRAEQLANKRLMNVNVWRGVRPVLCSPLAVCDARSVEKGDFMLVRLGEAPPPPGPVPGGLNVAYNPNHHWYYYPDMQPDEAIAFRLFDTANKDWHMTPHTAIVDPTAAPDAPKRMSYELRTLAVFN